MKKLKKLFSVLMVITMCAALFAGCASKEDEKSKTGTKSEKKMKVVYMPRTLEEMYGVWLSDTFKEIAETKYGDYFEWSVIELGNDATKVPDAVENAIVQGADIIIAQLFLTDYTETVQTCVDENVGFIGINMNREEISSVTANVAVNEFDLGCCVADYMAENLPKNAKILLLNGPSGADATIDRRRAVMEHCIEVRPDVTILDEQYADFDKNLAMNITEDWLQTYEQIDAIWAASDGMSTGAIEAYRSSGIDTKNTMFFGIDGLTEACQSIVQKEMTASALQDAQLYAELTLEVAYDIYTGKREKNEPGKFYIEPSLVDSTNAQELLDRYTELGLIK